MSKSARNRAVGRIITRLTPNPAAGANASLGTPDLSSNIILCVSFKLITDVNAVNREVHLDWHQGANQRLIGAVGLVHGASTTHNYLFTTGTSPYLAANVSYRIGNIAYPIDFHINDNLELVVEAIQAGDQLSLITSWWEIYY